MIRKGSHPLNPPEITKRYGKSVSFDWRIYHHDFAGSIAHAARAGLNTAGPSPFVEREAGRKVTW